MRVRHFGFLANRSKKQNLAQCRELLGIESRPNRSPKKSARELMLVVTGVDLALCPECKVEALIVIAQLPALQFATSRAHRSPPTSSGFIMINRSLITLLPVVHCAWLSFESMDSCVPDRSVRSRIGPLAESNIPLRIPFFPLNSPRLHYT